MPAVSLSSGDFRVFRRRVMPSIFFKLGVWSKFHFSLYNEILTMIPEPSHNRSRRYRMPPKARLVFILWMALCLLLPSEQAPNGSGPTPQAALFRNTLRVATLNMYVGFDMAPAVSGELDTSDPRNVEGLIGRLGDTFKSNRPDERIRAMARELVKAAPDVISLQEAVSLKLYGFPLGDYAADVADEIRNLGGPDYGTLSLETFSLEGTFGAGAIPAQVAFQDNETVLYRKEMRCRGLDEGRIFTTARAPARILGEAFALKRGVIGMNCVSPSGRPFYLYNTHLDVISQGSVQESQALELVDYIRATAVNADHPVIVTGDFNAREDLSRTRTYAILREAGFSDAFRERYPDPSAHPGFTCCQSETLRNAASIAGGRYDYVFFKGGDLGVKEASLFANAPFPLESEPAELWPSDHFGVWADFEWEGGAADQMSFN